jgi:diaminohydroxyphosphoribosylaminopyrimidine deaminase/5-amino-6-(5-phosphoribosylamino)uracil reductase
LKHEEHPNLSLIRLDEEDFLNALIHDLYKQKIQSIIIEGGAYILSRFIELNLWDEARTFSSDKTFKKGIGAPSPHGNLISQESILNDTLKIYHPR